MSVKVSPDHPAGANERIALILSAACRAIARSGARALTLNDVAREAGVSKALIHYYLTSREELLARAYEFADDRARVRVQAEIAGLESAAVRLKQLFLLYFTDEAELLEDWILWSELSSSALFEDELRPTMEASFAQWIVGVEALIQEAVEEGSLPEDTDPSETALRLTALIDGFGLQLVRGLTSPERARELLKRGLERELGAQDEHADERRTGPATGYLRRLAGLTRQAVGDLEGLTSSNDDQEAIRTVCALIDKVGGGAASRVSPPSE